MRVFPHTRFSVSKNDRKLFNKHGLHPNKLGKKLVTFQLACHILTNFQSKTSPPIPLGWHETVNETKPLSNKNQAKTLNGNSSRNKKTPVTRSNDFLWST